MKKITFKLLLIILVAAGFVVCSSKESEPSRQSSGSLDKPAFHVKRGDDYLIKKNYLSAETSYKKALELNPDDIYAQSGTLLAKVYLAADSSTTKQNALKHIKDLEKLKDNAQNKEQKARVLTYQIRALTALQLPANWYAQVQDIYEDLEDMDSVNEEVEFFMAEADTEKLNIKKAIGRYERILGKNSPYEDEADKKLIILQKIRRVLPISEFGKDIAFTEKITRADVAGLLAIELDIEKLYRQHSVKVNHDFKKPKGQERLTTKEVRIQKAIDIQGHPMFDPITEVLNYGIRGLEADASGKFYPDKPITRAEMAVIIEDIMIQVTKQPSLATKYIGEESPFSDVSPDKWYYNAARIVIERQFLTLENKTNGEFKPINPISGADALLAIKELKKSL